MTEIRLTDEQLTKLAVQIAAQHPCRFSDTEAKSMYRFADAMGNGGWDKFASVLDFGATLIQVRKAGVIAAVTVFIGAILATLWLGLKSKL